MALLIYRSVGTGDYTLTGTLPEQSHRGQSACTLTFFVSDVSFVGAYSEADSLFLLITDSGMVHLYELLQITHESCAWNAWSMISHLCIHDIGLCEDICSRRI